MNKVTIAICSAAIASVSTILFGAAAQAQGVYFDVSTGEVSPTGETNQGAFSEFAEQDGFATINFNDIDDPFQAIEYSSGDSIDGFATYSFSDENGSSQVVPITSGQIKWAPDGANNEVNETPYLQVFSDSAVTIELAETLNYFGANWGSASPGNIFSFFDNEELVGSFNVDDIAAEGFAFTGTRSGQGTGYVDFRSSSEDDNFNRIVISQIGGGGFETDNHTFRVGTGAFSPDGPQDVPEPGALVGLGLLGLLGSRKMIKK